MKYLPFVSLIMMPLLALPIMIVASAGPFSGGPVLVVSPWGEATQANISQAGGRLIGPQSAPLGAFATSDDPDFPQRLKASGAWAVINGARLAAICGVET